jgi:hypothetical protein
MGHFQVAKVGQSSTQIHSNHTEAAKQVVGLGSSKSPALVVLKKKAASA